MTCPRCQTAVADAKSCPGCGLRFARRLAGVVKTSIVMISTNDDDGFYSSVREVPAPLRGRLEAATNGENSGTILIADKGGREQLLARAAAKRQPPLHTDIEETGRPDWAIWAGAALLLAATAITWMVFRT